MARIRSVHPGLFTDEAYVSVSVLARYLAIGIWTEADDQGVFEWKPISFKMRILPVDGCDVTFLLSELEGANIIGRFMVDNVTYGAIRNFQKYQRPKKPQQRFPLPEEWRKYVSPEGHGSRPVASHPPPVRNSGGSQQDEVPPELPIQPRPFLSEGELAPQMEDGGWRMDTENPKDGFSARRKAAPAAKPPPLFEIEKPPKDAKDALWRQGVPIVERLTGKPERAARSLLGKLLGKLGDDAAATMQLLVDAEEFGPAEPTEWLIGAAQDRRRRRSRIAKMSDTMGPPVQIPP
jgi:hypothetical protein